MKKKEKKSGLRKIKDWEEVKPCKHPEHNPPAHMVYSPGVYEYTCPGCGDTITFTIAGFEC